MGSFSVVCASNVFMLGLVLTCLGSLVAQGVSQGQCQYHLTVSSPIDCSQTDPRMEQKLQLIREDIDRSRLTRVTQNSAVQGQIIKLKSVVDRVDVDLDTVKTKIAALLPNSPSNNINFKQLQNDVYDLNVIVVNIRDDLAREIRFLQQHVSQLNASLVLEKVERFKVEAGLQSQMNTQTMVISDLERRVVSLENLISSGSTKYTSSTVVNTSSTTKTVGLNLPKTTNNFNHSIQSNVTTPSPPSPSTTP